MGQGKVMEGLILRHLLATVRRLQWLPAFSADSTVNLRYTGNRITPHGSPASWRFAQGDEPGRPVRCGPSPSCLRHPSPRWKYRGILCERAMWAGTAKRNRPHSWVFDQGLGISVTVDCILSECVVTDVQLGNNPCERRFSVLTFLRAVGFSAVCRNW
jgi:hypothetical protein